MIAIVDYNVGNLNNLKNALDYQHIENRIVREPEELVEASHIILPGVGAFRPAMERLRESGMIPVIRERVAAGTPFLGVCVGMQLLLEESEEDGLHEGLGLLRGRITRFKGNRAHGSRGYGNGRLKVPQIGWNQVAWQREDPLNEGIPGGSYFYFVHSYHAAVTEEGDALGLTEYGETFPSVVRHANVWGVQFHPEKSQNAGLRLLKNFTEPRPS
jgi:glutamine amidotransferase